jgi:hypothetical protein
VSDVRFTGYDPAREPREKLVAAALDYDFEQFRCSGDIPPTRGIKDLMRQNGVREDQWAMNACAGFGMVHGSAVGFYLATGVWRTFNPHWTYRLGQKRDGINGDNGATIHNVVESGKLDGLLPQDVENDGKKEFPFPRDQYNFRYPPIAAGIAKDRKVGYSVVLRSFRAILNFLQAGQGAVIIGGPWGNWRPDANGICRQFRSGGGGHARAYVDWVTINGEVMLDEANSHFLTYGDEGHAYHTESFVDAQCRDPQFVAIGVSDISLGPGDKPKQRRHRRFVKLT